MSRTKVERAAAMMVGYIAAPARRAINCAPDLKPPRRLSAVAHARACGRRLRGALPWGRCGVSRPWSRAHGGPSYPRAGHATAHARSFWGLALQERGVWRLQRPLIVHDDEKEHDCRGEQCRGDNCERDDVVFEIATALLVRPISAPSAHRFGHRVAVVERGPIAGAALTVNSL